MIYTLTLNPAVDYVMHAGELAAGATNRSACEEIYFGGKGINVSVMLSRLGVENTALGLIGGFTGDALETAVRENGVRADFTRLKSGCTRINVKLKGACETEINARGPEITGDDLCALYEKLAAIRDGDTLVLAGSAGTLPSDIYSDMMVRLDGQGIRFVVDASGALLTNVLKHRPFLIKPNVHELEQAVGRSLAGPTDIEQAACALRDAGAENVLVSLGGDGAILADASGAVRHCDAPFGRVINSVGAGDSMVAGFLAGIERGYDHALALGIAAGSATAFSPGLATRDAVMEILENII